MNPNYPFSSYPQGLPRPSSDADTIAVQYSFKTADNMSRSGLSGNNNLYYTSDRSLEGEVRMRQIEETSQLASKQSAQFSQVIQHLSHLQLITKKNISQNRW